MCVVVCFGGFFEGKSVAFVCLLWLFLSVIIILLGSVL